MVQQLFQIVATRALELNWECSTFSMNCSGIIITICRKLEDTKNIVYNSTFETVLLEYP